MKIFIEGLEKNCRLFPDRPAVVTDFHEKVLTYGDLWDRSGRVYAWLKAKGIGKEDFVMIRLQRGTEPVAAMIGILRAGAAFVLTETIYPPERIAYIQKDCGCVQVIDEKLYEEMMGCAPLEGFEETDPHDACFAVYTSGTTGNPKGVLHEYGKLSYLMESLPQEVIKSDDSFERFAAIMPMSFVAFVIASTCMLYNKDTLYVISFALSKNFMKFGELLETECITETFMTPSMLRFYKTPASGLKIIATGSEPANGIYYGEKPMLLNLYSSSESGFFITQFIVDRMYDRAPVGKNGFGMPIFLLDENGKEVKENETGEICFENPFTRGYIHLPEQTAAVFRDGIYHTGDLGFKDENGDLIISGRADDMIKINGNRIEPAEIEAAARELMGVSNVVAKGFDEGDSAFVTVYFLRKEVGDRLDGSGADELREALGRKLPPYMTPSYVVVLDEMPLNANGKVSRKLLPSPRRKELERMIEAPEGDREKLLCETMAKVLELDAVGPNEDFYYLGGDSMKTIRLVTELAEAGLDVDAEKVYEGRTARALASVCKEGNMTSPERDRAEAEARGKTYPLLHGQMQVIHYGMYDPNRQFADIGICMKLKPEVNTQKLLQAADKVLAAHPSLRIRISRDESGAWQQRYEEEGLIKTLELSAKEAEVPEIARRLHERYTGLKGQLFVSALIRTEGGFYYALVLSHVIADGASSKILLSQIRKAYEEDSFIPPRDDYFTILDERLKKQTEKEAESTAYYDRLFDGQNQTGLKQDQDSDDRKGEILYLPGALDAREEYDTGTFLSACALALAQYNKAPSAIVCGAYHGRNDVRQMQSAGYLMQDTFVRVNADGDRKYQEIVRDVKEQLTQNIILDSSLYLMKRNIDLSGMVKLIFQNDYRTGGEMSGLAEKAEVIPGSGIANGVLAIHVLQKSDSGKLDLLVRYAKAVYKKESIECFLRLMLEKLNSIVNEA